MILIDGKKVSNEIKKELKQEVEENNLKPGLGIILVGDRKDSQTYVRMKKKACSLIGIINYDVKLPENITEEELIEEVNKMNNNDKIHGILIQLPLPNHINEANILNQVKLSKDVDGFHTENIGKLALKRLDNLLSPCTPEGCIELLDRYNIEISGKNAVIIGRSNIVGLPLSLLLLHRNATVTICHSRTSNLKEHTQKADILIAACGRAEFIKKEHIKDNCVIIDIGINAITDETKKRGYRLVGDVDFNDVKDKVKAITPVPGGVGPMTIAMLLKHTIEICKK
jgi:5,10-methylene-tetrahydrofolate dehydrogenase/methenyl tetrahydrofolate cyclohydrolase